jgi:hypothetical protein
MYFRISLRLSDPEDLQILNQPTASSVGQDSKRYLPKDREHSFPQLKTQPHAPRNSTITETITTQNDITFHDLKPQTEQRWKKHAQHHQDLRKREPHFFFPHIDRFN